MNELIWLFPLVFMFHNFEEIIFFKPWVKRNTRIIHARFPLVASKLLPHFSKLSTSAFALGIAIYFILISIITYFSIAYHIYTFWFIAFMGFFMILIVHVIQWIVFRKYVPVIITSLISLIYCFYTFNQVLASNLFTLNDMMLWVIAGIVIMVISVPLMHLIMSAFDHWLDKFEEPI